MKCTRGLRICHQGKLTILPWTIKHSFQVSCFDKKSLLLIASLKCFKCFKMYQYIGQICIKYILNRSIKYWTFKTCPAVSV